MKCKPNPLKLLPIINFLFLLLYIIRQHTTPAVVYGWLADQSDLGFIYSALAGGARHASGGYTRRCADLVHLH